MDMNSWTKFQKDNEILFRRDAPSGGKEHIFFFHKILYFERVIHNETVCYEHKTQKTKDT